MSKRNTLSPLSIRQRLPLFICILLLGVIAVLAIISYIGVKRTALAVGKERLESLTEQVSNSFSARAMITPVRLTAGQPAIKKYLASGGTDSAAEAMAALEKLRMDRDTFSVVTELLNLKRVPVLRAVKKGTNLNV